MGLDLREGDSGCAEESGLVFLAIQDPGFLVIGVRLRKTVEANEDVAFVELPEYLADDVVDVPKAERELRVLTNVVPVPVMVLEMGEAVQEYQRESGVAPPPVVEKE